ncbi:NAD-dependent malic enzyme, partial [Saccharothrix sp. MB29]|nr:NAD-dependent malic enzyme [Saccharothrix sp. MB29]
MPVPGPGYSITVRLEAPPSASAAGDLTSAVGRAGGVITAFDVVESHTDRVIIDLTCNALSANHAKDITDTLELLPGIVVRKVSDRTFLVHLGGKIEISSKVPLRNRDDLSRAYTPGVARVCMAIAENPGDARRLTLKRNTVAVVTDGSAVLGQGNIGPPAP